MSKDFCRVVDQNHLICTLDKGHTGDHEAWGAWGLSKCHNTWPQEPIRVAQRSRLERLVSLSSNGTIAIQTVAQLFDCPEASVRRDIQTLRKDGYVIELWQGQIRCDGKRKDVAHG